MAKNGKHIVGPGTYTAVFVALVVFTVITVWAANQNFGSDFINTVVALSIATAKALLVAAFFMHLKYEGKMTYVYIALGLLLLAILIGFSLVDVVDRPDYFPSPEGASPEGTH